MRAHIHAYVFEYNDDIYLFYVGIAFGVKEHLDPACMHGEKIQLQIINTKYWI